MDMQSIYSLLHLRPDKTHCYMLCKWDWSGKHCSFTCMASKCLGSSSNSFLDCMKHKCLMRYSHSNSPCIISKNHQKATSRTSIHTCYMFHYYCMTCSLVWNKAGSYSTHLGRILKCKCNKLSDWSIWSNLKNIEGSYHLVKQTCQINNPNKLAMLSLFRLYKIDKKVKLKHTACRFSPVKN